jgi:predicted DNA-binding transcriptional regulator YafY
MDKGRPRTVHPRVVQPGLQGGTSSAGGASGIEKFFVVDRMRNLVLDKKGSARPGEQAARKSLDPATWKVDRPTDVEVETAREFAEQVELAFHSVVAERVDGDRVVLTLRVTNRSAFRRIYALGTQVRVLGPDDVRRELVAQLERLAEDE